MHTIEKSPITFESFEIDDFNKNLIVDNDVEIDCWGLERTESIMLEDEIDEVIHFLEKLRKKYLETKDKRYWKELIRWLPESWLQTRTVTMNYENLLSMCSKGQRRFHKLNEWSGQDNHELTNFIAWARTLPYAQQFIFGDELED